MSLDEAEWIDFSLPARSPRRSLEMGLRFSRFIRCCRPARVSTPSLPDHRWPVAVVSGAGDGIARFWPIKRGPSTRRLPAGERRGGL